MFSNEKESLLKNEQTPSYNSSGGQNTVDTKQPSLNGGTRAMDSVSCSFNEDDYDDGGLYVSIYFFLSYSGID